MDWFAGVHRYRQGPRGHGDYLETTHQAAPPVEYPDLHYTTLQARFGAEVRAVVGLANQAIPRRGDFLR